MGPSLLLEGGDSVPLVAVHHRDLFHGEGLGEDDVRDGFGDVVKDLSRRERDDTQRALVGGDGYRTLWSREDG